MQLLGRRAECEALDRVLADAVSGRSRVVVLRGEAGAGKSVLLDRVTERAARWHVAGAVGIESEMELPYSGLHQVCAPMLDRLDRLPSPQRAALATVFGRETGPVPDRFLIGLAALTLFADVAEEQPLLCVIDDAQWLDNASAQILGFVARRLPAERIALICATRTEISDDVFSGLPAMRLDGLGESDARALLLENMHGPLDAAVSEQILAESHGNPLALRELPRTWSAADLAGGFGIPASRPVVSKIEESYARRLLQLPAATQLLVLAAAAEPLGDPVLLRRAAEALGLEMVAIDPAEDAGLLSVGARIAFAHPLVRSAAYNSASASDRHRVHRAFAEATDPVKDPDRRAWHRARATPEPDEEVAAELERSAGRAQSRGGLAAAAAFLERAVELTPERARRARRALVGAEIKCEAGSFGGALALLARVEAGPSDDIQRCRMLMLRARIAFAQGRSSEVWPLLLGAARIAELADVNLARLAYLEALHAALHEGRFAPAGPAEVSEAALACPASPGSPQPRDLLLDGLATRVVHGYAAGAPLLKQAVAAFRRPADLSMDDAHWAPLVSRAASDLWDYEARLDISTRELARARLTGALAAVPTLLGTRSTNYLVAGELEEAASTLDEARAIGEATGVSAHSTDELLLVAFQGREPEAASIIGRAAQTFEAHRDALGLATANYSAAILYNGLGRYKDAVSAVGDAGDHPYVIGIETRAVAELVEAAVRSGYDERARRALERLAEISMASGTAWARGVEARSRALLSEGTDAENLYQAAIEILRGTRLRPELARAHLLYGEWLRREGRRNDARGQLRTAYGSLAAMGMEAFAERARRELVATGDKARHVRSGTRLDLTPQETQIAQLARAGHTNLEIGAQLFLSTRTVEWHLGNVFTKLDISSRKQLDAALRTTRGLRPEPFAAE